MKLAFYKYQFGTWKDYLIANVTRSKYSHVELILDNGVSISSSPRDGGVRFKDITYINQRWDYVEIDRDNIEVENEILKYRYDWGALFLHWIGLNTYKKFMCSDLIFYLLMKRKEFKTPEDIYNLAKSGYFNK